MSESFAPGVSRTLSAINKAFQTLVFQYKKPPLDSELNFSQQAELDRMSEYVRAHMHSGFLTDPVRTGQDYNTASNWSNFFTLGAQATGEEKPPLWANVNGWIVPVTGTAITSEGDLRNIVKLNPPPASGGRIDLVFLEVWRALVNPNPSTENKPAADSFWKYGNVEYGGTNIPDDMTDPETGFETTKAVQLQYRIRVFGSGDGSSVALDIYPDGLGDPNIFGQGTSSTVVSGLPFTNMREALGDAGLWRAGDGDPDNSLGTVDGYTYAIPICAVFRRNTSTFTAITNSGSPNHNGALNRNPSVSLLTDPREGAKALNTATLNAAIVPGQTGIIFVDNLVGSGLDDTQLNGGAGVTPANPLFVEIEGEIIKVIGVNSAVSPGELTIDAANGRGRFATQDTNHAIGAEVNFYNIRPDGLFSDEISEGDIMDMRKSVATDEWDYSEILIHNLASILRGDMKTSYKQAGGGNTQGVTVQEIGYMHADGGTAPPNDVEIVDGPDGIRTIFSDAASIQNDVTILCDDQATLVNGFTSTTFDQTSGWEVGADFKPSGFMNNLGANGWANGSSIFLYLGGEDGESGARATFRASGTRAVRFLSPREYWKSGFPDADPLNGNQNTFTMKFIEENSMEPAAPGEAAIDHPGPMYPLQIENFERPFIHLGGLLNNNLSFSGIVAATDLINPATDEFEIDLGIDFDAFGSFFPDDGSGDRAQAVEIDDASQVAIPLLRGQRTLYHMLTNGGEDRTGASSDVYIVMYGDTGSTNNNGCFQVIGAGLLTPYTTNTASASTRIVVRPLSYGITTAENGTGTWDTGSGGTLSGQMRSQVTNSEDGEAFTSGPTAASSVVVMTDLRGFSGGVDNPWFLYDQTSGEQPLSAPVPDGITVGPFTMTAANASASTPILPNSMNIIVQTNGGILNLEDNGSGGFVANAGLSAGAINYNTGLITLTFNGGFEPILVPPPEDTFELEYRTERSTVPSINPPLTQKLQLTMMLQYHPGRGSSTRVPGDLWRIALRQGDSTYLRQAGGVVDTTFSGETGQPGDEINYNAAHVQLYNRLPSLGLGAPTAPSFGGMVVAQSEQDREHEVFFDKGSKTIYLKPYQRKEMTLAALETQASPSLLGTLNYPSGDPKDAAGIWTANKTIGVGIPTEYVPRFGRQDIPYRIDTTGGAAPFLDGINHLFTDTITNGAAVNRIAGGDDNTGSPGVRRMLFQTGDVPTTGLTYGQRGTIIGPGADVTQGRKQTLNDVISSDLGATLQGVELPPYHGIVRVYGVYERNDFIAKGGLTFEDDRVTPKPDPPTNLLRRDADQQTLFIRQDGASDLTTAPGDPTETGDHTYIVPSDGLDITLIPTYTSGNVFTDFDYVVECSVFGFAKGFITENNYVLLRLHDGAGNTQLDTAPTEIPSVNMTLPSPAKLNDPVYIGFSRTPYQGDPYMTKEGSSLVATDYETRYGQIPVGDAFAVATPLPQVDSDGNSLVSTPNLRAMEVLASLDFYTTLGTGKIGGQTFAGTPLDIGHTENNVRAASRIPESASSPAFRILPRTFSEGQKRNTSRARLNVEILQVGSNLSNATVTITRLDDVEVVMVAKEASAYNPAEADQFLIESAPEDTARNLASRMTTHPLLGQTLTATSEGSSVARMLSVPVGVKGNSIKVEIASATSEPVQNLMKILVEQSNDRNFRGIVTTSNFRGGEDNVVNAGDGTSQIDLTGVTERLPLGILMQDSDFLGENPLNDGASAFKTSPSGIRPVQTLLPLTRGGGEEYTRFLGEPGSLIAQSDGAILAYAAAPAGTDKFRLFRGGGSSFVLSGRNPGGPIDWVSDSFPAALDPVLKGGILTCKALLVRNFVEEAYATNTKRTDGDELQIVIMTYGIMGNGREQKDGLKLSGEISPTGYGEGYAASDRYRLEGRPLYHGRSRTFPDPNDVNLATFTGIVVPDDEGDC